MPFVPVRYDAAATGTCWRDRTQRIGQVYAIGSAVTWAMSSVLLKGATGRLTAVPMNALRSITGLVFLLLVLLVTGRYHAYASLTVSTGIFLLLSVASGMIIGDTLYIRSQGIMGVARAMPIAGTYPLFTLFIAVTALHESVSPRGLLGVVLVVASVVALVLPEMLTPADRAGVSRDALLRGLGLALIAAVGWAGSASFLRLGLQDFDVVAASCLRLVVTFGALMLLGGGMRGARAWRQAGLRATSLVMLAGIVGSGLSAMMFLAAIQLAGTTQAATLSATAPLWAAPLSAIFLGEQMSGLLVLGIVMSVAGVWLLL